MTVLAAGAAPGKLILFGEHSVVYGRTAVAAALGHGLGATAQHSEDGPVLRIPRWGSSGLEVRPQTQQAGDAVARAFRIALARTGCDLNAPILVTIDGGLPLGVGLGSSAAFSIALLRALADYRGESMSHDEQMAAAEELEGVFHGNPSGLDHTVVTHGGCLAFRRDGSPRFTEVKLGSEIPLVVAWTPRMGTTREAVERLQDRRAGNPALYDRLLDSMNELAEAGIKALEEGDLEQLGVLFDLNHGYLNTCGVSSPANEKMVSLARGAGALGAKLTGAGCGGAIVALAPDNAQGIMASLKQHGFDAFQTSLGVS